MAAYKQSNTKDIARELASHAPFITIIIPVFNVEKYIARCLRSCINQSFGNIEIIIVDDCGDDNSMEIANAFAREDSRIRIIRNGANLGLFHTRIVGEREARGLYLLHLDSDDYLDYSTAKILYKKIFSTRDLYVLIENIWGGSSVNPPCVSIIIPVYNVEKYIKRCLESCINQTLSDIEIIIVDDCGNDNSMEIANAFARQDSRIRILKNEANLGTFNARIEGIKEARGKFILFVDADDYIMPNTCKKAYDRAIDGTNGEEKEYELPDIVFFGMRFYPPTLKRVAPPILLGELHKDEILKASFAHCATPPWHICAKLYKASHIMKTINLLQAHMGEFPRLNMAEDALKSFAILALAKKSIGIKDRLYVYCNNDQSITRRIDMLSTQNKIKDFDRVVEYLDRFGEIEEIRANTSYKEAKQKTQNILKAQKELELRYVDKSVANSLIGGGQSCNPLMPQYLSAALKSLKYHHKWQTYVRILAFVISLGKIKL